MQFCTSCVAVCDVWWWPVSSPCSSPSVVSYRSVRRMLALSRTHFCQIFSAQNNSLLENLAFPDDVSSVFLIFIIVSDILYIEMILPSVASCDSARTHPPFLASSRPPKNLRNEPCFCDYVKHINSIRTIQYLTLFNPFGPIFLEWNPPFGCFAFSEDHSRCLSHLRMLCLYITSYYSAFPKSHARRLAFSEDLCRHLSHLRMTCPPFASQNLVFPISRAGRVAFSEDLHRFYRICACPVSTLHRIFYFMPFRIALCM